jgi:hypothetical protein
VAVEGTAKTSFLAMSLGPGVNAHRGRPGEALTIGDRQFWARGAITQVPPLG